MDVINNINALAYRCNSAKHKTIIIKLQFLCYYSFLGWCNHTRRPPFDVPKLFVHSHTDWTFCEVQHSCGEDATTACILVYLCAICGSLLLLYTTTTSNKVVRVPHRKSQKKL